MKEVGHDEGCTWTAPPRSPSASVSLDRNCMARLDAIPDAVNGPSKCTMGGEERRGDAREQGSIGMR